MTTIREEHNTTFRCLFFWDTVYFSCYDTDLWYYNPAWCTLTTRTITTSIAFYIVVQAHRYRIMQCAYQQLGRWRRIDGGYGVWKCSWNTYALLSPQPLISALYNPIPMCSHDDVKCDGGGVYSLCEWSSCHAIVSREDSNRVTTERLRRMICLHFHLHVLILHKGVHHILLFGIYILKNKHLNSPKATPHQSV